MSSDLSLRVVFLGSSGVGKTSLVNRLVFATFSAEGRATVGAGLHPLVLQAPNGRKIEFKLWDTAGQERYAPLARSYLRNADIAICCFSPDVPGSIEALAKLHQTVLDVTPRADLLFVFAKEDLMAEHEDGEGVKLRGQGTAEEFHAEFISTSARTGAGIDLIREQLIRFALHRAGEESDPQRQESPPDTSIVSFPPDPVQRRTLCC
jgi:small GTP-binding protein